MSRRHLTTFRLPLSVAVTAALLPLVAAGNGCGGMEFCGEGSTECRSPSGGSAGKGSGGSAGKGGSSAGKGGNGGEAQGGSTTMGGDGGEGQGGAGGAAGPSICDLTDLESVELGCVAPAAGIFVRPDPTDFDPADNLGTQDDPVLTIARGVELALDQELPLFVCNATFEEQLILDKVDGLSIYAGFSCDEWLYEEKTGAAVAPAVRGYALQITGSSNISIANMAFTAQPGNVPGASSIAAFVSESDGITLTRVKLSAGAGVNGAPGYLEPYAEGAEWPLYLDLDGANATAAEGGDKPACTCPGGATSNGGLGGDGHATTPGPGAAGTPDHDGPGGEGGVVTLFGCTDGVGKDGADGPVGASGNGAATLATLDASGWVPSSGTHGQDGKPGQGGGGGAGAIGSGDGGGGSGGCGGCGGARGFAGEGGGSSIGLLLFESVITLSGVEIETAGAGDGGDGVPGQAEGQQRTEIQAWGGNPGAGTGAGCPGGRGGKGGPGGASGGGAGGVSVGVVYAGTMPDGIDEALIVTGQAGAMGGGAGTPAIAGLAAATLEIP